MKATVDGLLATQAQNLQQLGNVTARLDLVLRDAALEASLRLRALLLGGSAVAALLLGLMLYFAWRSRQAARIAEAAQRQVSNILGTVREGLFLLDRDLRLGDTYSKSLTELLRLSARRPDLHIEDMLKPLVDDKTLHGGAQISRPAVEGQGSRGADRVGQSAQSDRGLLRQCPRRHRGALPRVLLPARARRRRQRRLHSRRRRRCHRSRAARARARAR